jgi:polyisoprenoid-binding protein YceI
LLVVRVKLASSILWEIGFMRKALLTVAAAAGVSALSIGALHAQGGPQLPGSMDASRVAAGTYQLDAAHTLVGWRVNHFGFNDYFGLFGNISGSLEIDPADVSTAQLDVTIPIAEVVTASAGLTQHLLRAPEGEAAADFFGANPQPARFVSTSVERTGETTANVTGDLTLNGVTRPVTIAAEFTGAGPNPMSQVQTVGFEGTATINRQDFNINFALPMVGNEVELDLTAAFEKR